MSSTTPTPRVIFDTRDNLIHYAVPDNSYYRDQFELEGIEEFAAYLNKKADSDRFTVVGVTPLLPRGRSGLTRHYATFMKGEPHLRIRAALKSTPDNSFTLTRQRGAWVIPELTRTIESIASRASVPFNEARQALWDYLKQQLGDVMDRVTFPPVNAITTDDTDGLPDPLD